MKTFSYEMKKKVTYVLLKLPNGFVVRFFGSTLTYIVLTVVQSDNLVLKCLLQQQYLVWYRLRPHHSLQIYLKSLGGDEQTS